MGRVLMGFLVLIMARCSQVSTIEEGTLEVDDDIYLYYQKIGNGEIKVILPLGFWLFDDFKNLVSEDRTLVFYDMRNRGRSSYVKDSTKITIEADVEDLEAIKNHFGWEKIHSIGESYLGLMVIMHAMKYPESVKSIVQIGAVPLNYRWWSQYDSSMRNNQSNVDSLTSSKIQALYDSGYHLLDPKSFSVKRWEKIIAPDLVANTESLSLLGMQWGGHLQYENEWFSNEQRHLQFHFFNSVQKLNLTSEEVQNITQRVLTIHGTKDRNSPYGSGVEWAYMLPNARLLTVENAGHIPWIEEPNLVLNGIDTFLRGRWPDGSEVVTEPPSRSDVPDN